MIGTNIQLRAPEPSDVDTLYLWENDPGIWHLGNTISPFSRFEIEQFVLNNGHDIYVSKQLRFMVDWHTAPAGKVTIGNIDLFDFEPYHKRAGIGILIDKPYRNQGFASEALQILIDYCFGTLMMHQLYCNIDSSNQESIRLFTRMGFMTCGLRKEWLLRKGYWADELMLQLINSPNQESAQ